MINARYIPAGSAKIANKSGSAVVYIFGLCFVGYQGKAIKPSAHFRYPSEEKRNAAAASFLAAADARKARKDAEKAAVKEELAEPTSLAVGDILRASWGYDQTNIDFYEVTKICGTRMIEIREIGQHSIETKSMQGRCVPIKGEFIGEPMRKKVNRFGKVQIKHGAFASKLEPMIIAGMEIYDSSAWTAYA
jgi:hypothetical protein